METIRVEFKERYMECSVIRECIGMTEQQVIDRYGLQSPDIEWYRFLD